MAKPSTNSSSSGNNNTNQTDANNSTNTSNNNTNNNDSSSTSTNNNTNTNNNNNDPRKPRRSIKAEGSCLNSLLRSGNAKVIDASRLGKRLSSEIWNSFGAIQVEPDFENPAIDTKTVTDGSSATKICQFFVACSRCFSVFKYDGHAYGTTGLVKHVKSCQASIRSSSAIGIHNGPVTTRHRRPKPLSKGRPVPPSLRHLARVIEELRGEQAELKQKINEMMNMMGTGYVDQIQIISNEAEKESDALQKHD